MLARERWHYIITKINNEGAVEVKKICNELDASESTIRRDLQLLEKENKLIRVHGGAIRHELNQSFKNRLHLNSDERSLNERKEKKALGRACADLVEEGDFIFIDSGSTFIYMIDYLEGKHVRVATNSDFIKTKQHSTIKLMMCGGHYVPKFRYYIGTITLNNIDNFVFDKVFISCEGVDIAKKEATTSETDSATVKEKAMENSKKKYLVFDDKKIGKSGIYRFCNLDEFDELITNKEADTGKLINVRKI